MAFLKEESVVTHFLLSGVLSLNVCRFHLLEKLAYC